MTRSRACGIAADLERAARAVREADLAIFDVPRSAWPEINTIAGIEHLGAITIALQALSDKYQAIADAEPEA